MNRSPSYLSFCIQMALGRPGDYVPTRLGYLILCAGANAEEMQPVGPVSRLPQLQRLSVEG